MAGVAYLCFAPPEVMPQLSLSWLGLPADKVGHFLMFVPFVPLAYMVFGSADTGFWKQLGMFAVILAVGSGLAIGTERIQAQLAYRTADINDFVADALGLVTGCIISTVHLIYRKR